MGNTEKEDRRGYRETLYDNCLMLHPNGAPMAFVSRSKMESYLKKKLAVIVSDEPYPQFRLLFEPGGPGQRNVDMMIPRENICVVCGADAKLSAHHSVPYRYRRWFPETLKQYASYDILALCGLCHNDYETIGNQFAKQLAKEYGIKLPEHPGLKNEHAAYAIKSLKTLLRLDASKVPSDNLERLWKKVEAYFGEGCSRDIKKYACLFHRKSSFKFGLSYDGMKEFSDETRTESYLMASSLKSDEDFERFIIRWRQHFVETMKPKYLPPNWRADKPLEHAELGSNRGGEKNLWDDEGKLPESAESVI